MNKLRKNDPDSDDDYDLSSYKINVKQVVDDEDEGGVGTAGLDAETLQAWLAALQIKALREGERKFGAVPDTKDPNDLLNKSRRSAEYGSDLKAHPLLSKTQRYSGDDPKLTARTSENKNEKAQRDLEHRLEHKLQNRHTARNVARKIPILTR